MSDPTRFTDVIYEVRDRAAWIIINRPKVYNAFRGQTLEELIQAFHLAANDRKVSSIVLTGAEVDYRLGYLRPPAVRSNARITPLQAVLQFIRSLNIHSSTNLNICSST